MALIKAHTAGSKLKISGCFEILFNPSYVIFFALICYVAVSNTVLQTCTSIKYFYSSVSQTDYPVLENVMKSIAKEKQDFIRLEMTKEDLLKMFEVSVDFELVNICL